MAPIPPVDPSPPEAATPEAATPVPLPLDPVGGPPEPPTGKEEDGEALGDAAPDGEGVTATDPPGDSEPGTTLPDADGDPVPEGIGSDGSGRDGLMLGSGIDGTGSEALTEGSGSVGIGNVGSGNVGSGREGNGSDGLMLGNRTEGRANGCSPTFGPITEAPAVARPRAS